MAVAAAMGLSIASLLQCGFVKGEVYFVWNPEEEEEEQVPTQAPSEGYFDSITATEAPREPTRFEPYIPETRSFNAGLFNVNPPSFSGTCLPYSNDAFNGYLATGSSEYFAQVVGAFGTFAGFCALLLLLALSANIMKKTLTIALFSVLVACAVLQALTFTIFASQHCKASFYEEFLSGEELKNYDIGVSCSLGTEAWYAIIAIALYIFAATLVLVKWNTPEFVLLRMDWKFEGHGAGTDGSHSHTDAHAIDSVETGDTTKAE